MRQWSARVLAFTLLLCGARAGWSQHTARQHIGCAQWVRFEVVLGQLTAVSPYSCQSRLAGADDRGQPTNESLSITADREHALIVYELVDGGQQLRVEITEGNRVCIRRISTDEVLLPGLEFTQDADGLKLELQRADLRQTYKAPTLWHLILAHPSIFQQQLLPILHRLRPDWELETQALRVQDRLLQVASAWRADDAALHGLVEQLASETYQVREAADRQLRSRGYSILGFLDRLDPTGLDVEQRKRIRQIRESLHVETGDTPQRVAMWLVEDKPIWLTMLAHEQLDVRRLAANHLQRITKLPIDFDPAGEGPERDAQIQQLAALLDRSIR